MKDPLPLMGNANFSSEMDLREYHPYGEFIPPHCESMIIGSFPIGKFTNPQRKNEIKDAEVDFFFGGERNLLWKILSEVFERPLRSKSEIESFLIEKRIGVGDVIKSCVRKEGRASDTDLTEIEWNEDLPGILKENGIRKIYFTSRQVERWFRNLNQGPLDLDWVTLPSPSGQAIRGLWRSQDYQKWKNSHPHKPSFSFLVFKYKEVFNRD